MNKKAVAAYILLVNVFVLSSCGLFINPENYKHNIEVNKKQTQASEDVLNAIFSQDEESLYDMFSQTNKDNCDLEEQIKELFDSVPVGSFDLSLIEKQEDGGGTSWDDGRITKHSFGYRCDKIFDNEGNEYLISFGYTVEDEKEPDLIGLASLLVARIERNDPDNQYSYEMVEEYTIGDITLYYKSY